MLALGGLMICAALLALAAAAVVFRSPNPPRWTRWSGELITLAIVTGFALGVAYLIAGVSNALEQGARLVDLGLLAVAIGGALVIWHRLGLRARLRSMPAETALRPTAGVAPARPKASAPEPPPSKPRPKAA